MSNPLQQLAKFGQSIWYDNIRRGLIASGELKRLIDDDGLRGVTSNPAIFEKAISGATDYREALEALHGNPSLDAKGLYEALAVADVQAAADVFRETYESSAGLDGYVSLEVSPRLSRDAAGTVQEARRLWKAVERPNTMIKVPATTEGIEATRELVGEGINVNVTLLFDEEVYAQVARAYVGGLSAFVAKGGDPRRVASVASFFISRIDTAVDDAITARLAEDVNPHTKVLLDGLLGKVAIANARLTYQRSKSLFRGEEWEQLAARGARLQRLLWASTGTKNPRYSDVLYVEELIGPDTVNTVPPATYDAFRHHGQPRASLELDLDGARRTMKSLARAGIPWPHISQTLLEQGLDLFDEAFTRLLASVEVACRAQHGTPPSGQSHQIPAEMSADVDAMLEQWRKEGNVRRLWARDATLWTGGDESRWMGWLGITDDQRAHHGHLEAIAEDVRKAGFRDIVLLGMGGSSLGPEVLAKTFGRSKEFPAFHVLDSTDPAQIAAIESQLDLSRTLFIVSSKSGSTLEPDIFMRFFFERLKECVGDEEAGRHFIAITDPGSNLEQAARARNFRHIFPGVASIGGRYSVLSNFGMVPAAAMGIDVARLLDRAEEMEAATSSCLPPAENPGVVLGTIMGVLAKHGRDKVTFVTSPGLSALGSWLEQLIAESTGKGGRGLIPVHCETLGHPASYGDDRLFVYIRLDASPDPVQDERVAALEGAGQPVVRIAAQSPYDLGREFFRWEIATAVAGAILGIHPFDQPDVEASKIATRELTSQYEKSGSLPTEAPILEEGGIRLFADTANAAELARALGGNATLRNYLKSHLGRLRGGDYLALLAYVPMFEAHVADLQAVRLRVRDRTRAATCLGFGPRFLHSTGQAYKGGPNTGVFIQITCDDGADLPVPGKRYTFGVVKEAQARGDLDVLAARGRRALRIHLGVDVAAGLDRLKNEIAQILG